MPDTWKQHLGKYIGAGGNIETHTMTIVEAKAKAKTMPGCKGFTHAGAASTGKVHIIFKNHFKTGPGKWTSYERIQKTKKTIAKRPNKLAHKPKNAVDAWKKHLGKYIGAGGDIATHSMTVAEAKAKAETMPGCKGFTHAGAASTGKVHIIFKNHFKTGPGKWTSYERLLKARKTIAKEPKKQVVANEFTTREVVTGLPGAAKGIPIMCFPCVADKAAKLAKSVIYNMLKDGDQGVVRRMCQNKCSVGIIGMGQVGSDLPPHAFLKNLRTFDGRSYDEGTRGVGGTKAHPLTSVGEENVTMAPSDKYSSESILVHEFAHAVMNLGFNAQQMQRIDKMYSIVKGARARAGYMYANKEEWWAMATQAWFKAIVRKDNNNGINTRQKLRKAHPGLAKLMEEVYGNGAWRYIDTCPNPTLWKARQ